MMSTYSDVYAQQQPQPFLTNPVISGVAPRPAGWVGPWPPPDASQYSNPANWTNTPGNPMVATYTGPATTASTWTAGQTAASTPPPPPPPADLSAGILAPYTAPAPTFPTVPAYTPGTFTAPTIAEALNDPGYQFRVQQGENALQNWAAAKGTLNDSGTAKALLDYGQNAAEQGYGNVYARDFGTWQANEAARAQAYGLNRQTQSIDPWTAAYNAWAQKGNFYLNNQGTAANAALHFAQLA